MIPELDKQIIEYIELRLALIATAPSPEEQVGELVNTAGLTRVALLRTIAGRSREDKARALANLESAEAHSMKLIREMLAKGEFDD